MLDWLIKRLTATPAPIRPGTEVSGVLLSATDTSVLAVPGTSSLFMTLPPELFLYIAQFISKRSRSLPTYVTSSQSTSSIANSDLTALASACLSLRRVLLPVLFINITVNSSTRLKALATAPRTILRLIRSLSVELGLEFYETWTWSLDRRTRLSTSAEQPNAHPSDALHSLALILLASASQLRSLSFIMRMTEESLGSAWTQFPRPRMAGVLFGGPVVDAMKDISPETFVPTFLELEELNLDATADVYPLLSLTPNLISLRLRIADGFNAQDCKSIVCSLTAVPKLRKLEMWVWELASAAEVRDENVSLSRTKLFEEIGDACPELEWLGFQTRSYDFGDGCMALKVLQDRAFDWKDLMPALQHFPALTELHLPSSLYMKGELHAYILQRHSASAHSSSSAPTAASSSGRLPALRTLFSGSTPAATSSATVSPTSQAQAFLLLEKIQQRERETAALLMRSSRGRLCKVGWAREEGALTGFEYALIDGEVQGLPPQPVPPEYRSLLFDSGWDDEAVDSPTYDVPPRPSSIITYAARYVYSICSSSRPSQCRPSSISPPPQGFDPHFVSRATPTFSYTHSSATVPRRSLDMSPFCLVETKIPLFVSGWAMYLALVVALTLPGGRMLFNLGHVLLLPSS